MAYKDIEKNKEYQKKYYQEHKEEMRERKNAAQREYAKRSGYASNKKYNEKNTKVYTFRVVVNTENDIIERLDKKENKAGYIKSLIRADIEKNP